MALDPVPTYPGQYDALESNNNPDGSETRREGDDQIRRMKASEKATWTNVTGAVTASHSEINRLVGISLTDPIITFPSTTTKQLFYQDTAPTGWTIDAAVEEHSVRLTQGNGGGSVTGGTTGGTANFGTVFSVNQTDLLALTESHIPSHDHGGGSHIHPANVRSGNGNTDLSGANTFAGADSLGGQMGHTTVSGQNNNLIPVPTTTVINPYGGGTGHQHGVELRLKWAACIVATKD